MEQQTPRPEVTQLLADIEAGRRGAQEQLLPLVYDELRRVASSYMRRERPNHTLQATALVHEAYIQLVDQTRVTWRNRAHFFAVAAQLMRRILVDHARAYKAQKRGGPAQRLSLEEATCLMESSDLSLEALDEALNHLAHLDPRQSRIVELRFFGGLTVDETSEILGISPPTVEREWRMARAWLHSRLSSV